MLYHSKARRLQTNFAIDDVPTEVPPPSTPMLPKWDPPPWGMQSSRNDPPNFAIPLRTGYGMAATGPDQLALNVRIVVYFGLT